MVKQNSERKIVSIEQVLDDIVSGHKQCDRYTEMGGTVETGFPSIDDVIKGFHPSDVVLITGGRKIGKTELACNIAKNVITNCFGNALFFSLEMSKERLAYRFITDDQKKDDWVSNNTYGFLRWLLTEKSLTEDWTGKILIDDTPGISVEELCKKCLEIRRQKEICLIVIDYLQLVTINKICDSNIDQSIIILRMIRELAKKMRVPIVVISEFLEITDPKYDDFIYIKNPNDFRLSKYCDDAVIAISTAEAEDDLESERRNCFISRKDDKEYTNLTLYLNKDSFRFEDPIRRKEKEFAINAIKIVCNKYRLDESVIKSGRRNQALGIYRQIILYLCRQLSNQALLDLGVTMGIDCRSPFWIDSKISEIMAKAHMDRAFNAELALMEKTLAGCSK